MEQTRIVKPLTLAHCSDIHLDGDHGDANHYMDGFVHVLACAQAARPDVVVVAGDLFDSNRAPSDIIEWAMDELAKQPCPVLMIPGNHDCMEPGAIFGRYDFNAIKNVEMLLSADGEMRIVDSLNIAVWGKGMDEHSPAFRPVQDVTDRPDNVDWYIGIGHGMYVPDGGETYRSSPVHEGDIAASPFDYLALGHHHAALEVHAGGTAATYSGSPTDTIGRGATFVMVELTPDAPAAIEIREVD
jgi:DNA repair protein SbcD/Mre11